MLFTGCSGEDLGEAVSEGIYNEPKIGSIITFGGYEWRVLDLQHDYALVITENIIEVPYLYIPDVELNLTWEVSFMREYLNGDFLGRFSMEDRARILETTVINNNNPWFDTSGGNDTVDKVFFLSLEEVIQYFGDSGQLSDRPVVMQYFSRDYGRTIVRPPNTDDGEVGEPSSFITDQYSAARTAYFHNAYPSGFFASSPQDELIPFVWWLRTPGHFPHSFVVVQDDGWINVQGGGIITRAYYGIRPAVWLRVE